jgi:hypothetical protein
MSTETNPKHDEKPKLVVSEHSPKSLEYIAELDSYEPGLEAATPQHLEPSFAKMYCFEPGTPITVVYGIKRITMKVVKYNPPFVTGVDKYGKVWTFNLTRVAAVSQDLQIVKDHVKRLKEKRTGTVEV